MAKYQPVTRKELSLFIKDKALFEKCIARKK